jgi:hypothetical protein
MSRSSTAAPAIAIVLGMSAGAQADCAHSRHRHAAKAVPVQAAVAPLVGAPRAAPRERDPLLFGAADDCGLVTVGNFNSCSGSRLAPNGG